MSGPWVPFRFDAAYLVPFAVGIFCLARYQTVASRALATPIMVRLGEASYASYLLHALLLAMLRDWQIGLGAKTALLHHVIVFVLITTFAVGAYQCIENPLRRRIRRLYTYRTRRVAVPSLVGDGEVVSIAD